ncbi:hypothetical protein GCM10025864_05060 [Luteimicrobium album]|uniref:Uncharacterized protein n=1 Tax=Luteimicrobium album TaxID=1054550 RepID=A0ABQ6HX76_9MICO|nr:hypothetical protein GCM10025864_05060 [Luteimicrobium album]
MRGPVPEADLVRVTHGLLPALSHRATDASRSGRFSAQIDADLRFRRFYEGPVRTARSERAIFDHHATTSHVVLGACADRLGLPDGCPAPLCRGAPVPHQGESAAAPW